MKRGAWILALGLASGLAAGQTSGSGSGAKQPPPPFYRQYLVAGDPLDDKIVEQERRVEASPQDPNLRNDFGNLLALRRFPAQAAEQYEMALTLDKKNFISAYNLGLLREIEGKLSAAISAYQRSIKRKPGFPQSRFRLGRAYEHANQPELAVKEYAAAMWIDPAIRDVRRNPLVIDSELIYLASLANYQRDMAVASMDDAHVYFDNDRFRKLPVDRAISSKEVEADAESEPPPRSVGTPGSTGTTGASEPPMRHGQRTVPGEAAGQPGVVRGGTRPVPATRAKTPPRPASTQPVAPAPSPAAETVEGPSPDSGSGVAPEPTVTPGPPPEVEPS
jgi:hypothetical protein